MSRPEGHTRFDRVVMTLEAPLREALETELRGYAEIVPQAGLLGAEAGHCELWFDGGVPVGATHTGTGRTDSAAIADIAEAGPYRVRLVETADGTEIPRGDLSPAVPAEEVLGDAELARRTRELAAPDEPATSGTELDAVEAFLADEEKIEAIQQQAAQEARKRADEWGFGTPGADD